QALLLVGDGGVDHSVLYRLQTAVGWAVVHRIWAVPPLLRKDGAPRSGRHRRFFRLGDINGRLGLQVPQKGSAEKGPAASVAAQAGDPKAACCVADCRW